MIGPAGADATQALPACSGGDCAWVWASAALGFHGERLRTRWRRTAAGLALAVEQSRRQEPIV